MEIKFPEKCNQDRFAFKQKKLFIVNGLNKKKQKGFYIQVIDLDDGKTIKEFLAVSLKDLEGKTTSLCQRLKIEGDFLLLTISYGET